MYIGKPGWWYVMADGKPLAKVYAIDHDGAFAMALKYEQFAVAEKREVIRA
jgi:hypothetical protein